MRLIMLLGAAHGTVVESEDTPHYYSVAKREHVHHELEGDEYPSKAETLHYGYILFAHGPEEAYYVPSGFNNLQVIKGLLAAQ
ncbi:MAG: hypothetical protein [Bacteriophage sp.]|nr:MAG: hypothetical protein [Bacteriophage sp.]